jgi:hypothetical protein
MPSFDARRRLVFLFLLTISALIQCYHVPSYIPISTYSSLSSLSSPFGRCKRSYGRSNSRSNLRGHVRGHRGSHEVNMEATDASEIGQKGQKGYTAYDIENPPFFPSTLEGEVFGQGWGRFGVCFRVRVLFPFYAL